MINLLVETLHLLVPAHEPSHALLCLCSCAFESLLFGYSPLAFSLAGGSQFSVCCWVFHRVQLEQQKQLFRHAPQFVPARLC